MFKLYTISLHSLKHWDHFTIPFTYHDVKLVCFTLKYLISSSISEIIADLQHHLQFSSSIFISDRYFLSLSDISVSLLIFLITESHFCSRELFFCRRTIRFYLWLSDFRNWVDFFLFCFYDHKGYTYKLNILTVV